MNLMGGPKVNLILRIPLHFHKFTNQIESMSPSRPRISDTSFGAITVDHEAYTHDILITLKGKVKKRKKKLSKEIYGTSHTISLPEMEYIYEEKADGILIGSGQYGLATLSEEASAFLREKKCEVIVLPTPQAILKWEGLGGKWIGLFHITC